jgi:hypothetical protein
VNDRGFLEIETSSSFKLQKFYTSKLDLTFLKRFFFNKKPFSPAALTENSQNQQTQHLISEAVAINYKLWCCLLLQTKLHIPGETGKKSPCHIRVTRNID